MSPQVGLPQRELLWRPRLRVAVDLDGEGMVFNFRPGDASAAKAAKVLAKQREAGLRIAERQPNGLDSAALRRAQAPFRPAAPRPPQSSALVERPALTLGSNGDQAMFGSRMLEPAHPALMFQSSTEVADQYRLIRTRIMRHALAPQVIMFTSPSQGDGKTVNSINVAAMLSMAKDSDVLIIGGDANGDLNIQLGLESNLPGLTNVLADQVRIQRATLTTVQYPNLYILPCGTLPREMPELLNSAAFQTLMRYARASFRFVIIDAPPCGLVADYYLLESASDAVALVVRPDHTSRRMLSTSLEEIPRQKFLGVLMNRYQDYFFWRKLDYYGRPWD